jgi:hypothetical protein
MAIFFTINNNFTFSRIFDIFIKELAYKHLFGVLMYVSIAFLLAIKNLSKNSNKYLQNSTIADY